jgi:hypothetical protein
MTFFIKFKSRGIARGCSDLRRWSVPSGDGARRGLVRMLVMTMDSENYFRRARGEGAGFGGFNVSCFYNK